MKKITSLAIAFILLLTIAIPVSANGSNSGPSFSTIISVIIFSLVSLAFVIGIPVLIIISIKNAGKSSIKPDGTVVEGRTIIDFLTHIGIYITGYTFAIAVSVIIAILTNFMLGFIPITLLSHFVIINPLIKKYDIRKIKRISDIQKANGLPTPADRIKDSVDPAIIGYCQTYSELGQIYSVKSYLKSQLKARTITKEAYYILLSEFTNK